MITMVVRSSFFYSRPCLQHLDKVFWIVFDFYLLKKMDQRTCIKFCFKCADAFQMLTVAYGEATLDRSNIYRWYKMFSEGREDVNDEERAGRPSTSTKDEKINEVEKMILANRRITVREVAEDLNISICLWHSIFINDLGMRRVAAKFVPKLLNCDQKQHRMNIANEMLDSVRDDPNLLQRVITGDKAWVYGYDVETKAQSSQWKLPQEPRPKKARQVQSNVKVLLTVFFDCRGVVHHEFLPQGRTVNKEYYLQVMRNLREAIRQKRPELWKNKNWLLHHDNAPAHTSLLVRDLLAKNNTLMMPQPPYSPDLAPCDFFLFPKLKRPMKGRCYATLDEIKTTSKEELKKIFKNDFLKCFEDWKTRWHKCIISHGDYFEGDKIEEIEQGKSHSQVSRERNIPRSTISTIFKNKFAIKSAFLKSNFSSTLKRDRDGEFREIEEALFRWIRQANAMKLAINGNILKEKAILLALKMGQDNFETSKGWLEKFKAKRNIAFKRLHVEAGSVDANSVATWKGGIIPSLLAKYSPQDIFNADETGLFYKLLPNQTMTIRDKSTELIVYDSVLLSEDGKNAVTKMSHTIYTRSMHDAAKECLQLQYNDSISRFYLGVSLIQEGRLQEGIRELEQVRENKDVVLGSILALIYAHRKCKVVDQDTVMFLDSLLKESRKHPDDNALYYAGQFLFLIEHYDKAKEYVDRLIKTSTLREGFILKGWQELMTNHNNKKIIEFFENGGGHVDAILGQAKYYEKNKNYSRALDIINQLVVTYPNLLPALVEKMKLQLAMKDWSQTVDSITRILSAEESNLEAYKYSILHTICNEGDYEQGTKKFSDYYQILISQEPNNAFLYYDAARVFSRICERNPDILQLCMTCAKKASSLDPTNLNYASELGFQALLADRYKESIEYYTIANKFNESSVSCLVGIILCQVLQGQLEAATQQLELLKEIHRSSGMSSELLFICGLLAHKQNKSSEEVLEYLSDCLALHSTTYDDLPLGPKYLYFLNPDFLIRIAKLLFNYIPNQPVTSTPPRAITCAQHALQPINSSCPGLREATFLMAKLKYLSGDFSGSQKLLSQILNKNPDFSEAQLLSATLMMNQGNFQSAGQTLDLALSFSFEIRDKPQFHLIRAKIQKEQGNLEEAIKTLKVGMVVAGIKASSGKKTPRNKYEETTLSDKVSLYLELAECHRKLGQHHEAAKIMQDAINDFQGTVEEVRITIANADLALSRGDTEQAISILRNVQPDQPYYLESREKMANIYLNHRKDPHLYAAVYKEVADKFPTPQSFLRLGDAYMSIQEPEQALDIYEQALKKNPKDSKLAQKIGQALIKTHWYERAVTYYKAAIKTGGSIVLKYDLAKLLFHVKRYREAEGLVLSTLEADSIEESSLATLQWQAKFLALLAKVQQSLKEEEKAFASLQKAWEAQSRVMSRVNVEQPDSAEEQRKFAISVCQQLAEHCSRKRDFLRSMRYLKQALAFDENNTKLLLELANLEMIVNNLESARAHLTSILKDDKENNNATLMMAELMFRQEDLESSLFHFDQLLERKPNYYTALAKLIEVLRRLGKLEEVSGYLAKLEQKCPRYYQETGYHFCKGLHLWYTGANNAALKSLNKARNDPEWGCLAMRTMIEICCNFESQYTGGESFEENGEASEGAIRTAERLLVDLKNKPISDLDFRILSNFVLLAKKIKPDAEFALKEFMQILVEDKQRENLGAILGIAIAHMILKQSPRARNQLKRVAKNVWNFEDAEYLEKCWLLLAEIYIQSGKFDLASELIKKVIYHNKSCTRAYEYMGYVMEKEQSYKDAAEYYEIAWKQLNENNPVIGYKLAFNYLKAKRYVDAIDVSQAVLEKFPNYPKIEKEIFEKAKANLKV
ncbi:TTC21B [Cordylochernes scorpioides]|uniref:TTC21B n=1 Tax=Cordylochernes scorpioides TaxID=51811 RepID=A0ABY6LR22_9ARAC|nr:TTC21B [Cordylochernes scorpioides]